MSDKRNKECGLQNKSGNRGTNTGEEITDKNTKHTHTHTRRALQAFGDTLQDDVVALQGHHRTMRPAWCEEVGLPAMDDIITCGERSIQ